MQTTTGVALLLGSWASLYLLDAYLKTHRHLSERYISFLASTGLSVSVGQVRWYTTCFNRLFLRIGQMKPHFMTIWFTLGVVFGFFAMILSSCLLTLLLYNTVQQKPVEQQVLTPVMPGVNLPMSQISYYLLTLLVCGVLHEAGHAIAAVREKVHINGFGIFIMAIYPGAFVDLSTEHLTSVSPMKQLRIFCAGVWHNFIIVVAALLILIMLPWLLSPLYSMGSAVIVTRVVENSPVSGPRGLAVGDLVTSMNGCRITGMSDWRQCIFVSMKEENSGFCMSVDQVNQLDVAPYSYTTAMGNVECCSNGSATHLCFYYHSKESSFKKYACLPGRSVAEKPNCHLPSDCKTPSTPSVCVVPSLDNSTKLIKVLHTGKPPLLFLGHPLDLHYSVSLSDYVPNFSFLPVNAPYVIETFCKYLISLSGALALLNVVPCYALDGQWILNGFIEGGLKNIIPNQETRNLLYSLILLFGTILLAANVVVAMWMLFR